MLEDLRYALRSLGRSKAVTTVLLVSLALGTGVNAAVCGIVYALLLQPPAGVENPRSLLSIYTSEFNGSDYGRSSYPDYLSLEASRIVPRLAAYDDSAMMNVQLGDASRSVRVAAVTREFFGVLGFGEPLAAALSRTDAAVVSVTLAEQIGDPDTITGQRITIGDRTLEVVAVAPEDFRGLRVQRPTDVWMLMQPEGRHERGDRRLAIVARHDGADALNEGLGALSLQLADDYPLTNRGALNDPAAPRRLAAHPYARLDPNAGSHFAVIAAVVVGAVALLLASACVNAGTLLLSRAMTRRHELAVKRALGATRSRLIRQLFTESVLVCLGGGALGLLFAGWTTQVVPAFLSPDHAELLQTSGMWSLMALTLGVSLVAGVLFGVAPALQGTDAPESLALRGDAGAISEGPRRNRTRSLLLAAQLALSTVLLIITAVLVRSLNTALEGDFGVDAKNVAVVSMKYGILCVGHSERRNDAIEKLPGVELVGWAAQPPLMRGSLRPYSVQAGLQTYDRAEFSVNLISPSYFDAVGVPLLDGRQFTYEDRTRTEPVGIVDELLAQRYFGASAVGKHLIDIARGERIRIVGVVRSGRYRTLQDTPQPTVYRPLLQEHLTCGSMFVRTESDPEAALPAIVRHLERTERRGTAVTGTTLERHLSDALVIDRITTMLVGVCGVIALVMGAIGVYGAMSDAVLRRTREIGLRVALGAGRAQVVRLVLSEALIVSAFGVAIGIVASLAVERFLGSVVPGMLRPDVILIARTPFVLAIPVVLAAIVPLRRALAVNPADALGLRT